MTTTTDTAQVLTVDAWRALPDRPDFRRTATTYRDGWNGSTSTRTATYAGSCVLCGVRTYTDTGGDDPRGPLGDHAAAELDPAEYGATGAIVPACFLCGNDTEERYRRLLRRAERIGAWRYTEPAPDVDGATSECRCGAGIALAPGDAYAGWVIVRPSRYASTIHGDASTPPRHDPRDTARPDCKGRDWHHAGGWCERCGGWG
jgi:hypothetical protein